MARLTHYTLETGDSFDCSNKAFDKGVIRMMRSYVLGAIKEETYEQFLPAPFNSYWIALKFSPEKNYARFRISQYNRTIAINTVAFNKFGAKEIWEKTFDDYEANHGHTETALGGEIRMPSTTPWLATSIINTPLDNKSISWIADFEQCLAVALIKEFNDQARKASAPKGFAC